MNLSDFLAQADQDLVAKKAGTSRAYLYQIATGRRHASPKLARRIHAATAGVVSLEEIRPDVWGGVEINNKHAQSSEVERAKERRKRD
jgi:DNA-binding transcriptional regulator YdaS (Cro superfamily)